VELMLHHKGIPYRRRDLPNMSQRVFLPLLGYRGRTVPVLRADDRRVEGTMRIARFLDEQRPDPALAPDDARALELEAWADDTLQDNARRLAQWAAKHDRRSVLAFALGSRLPLPRPLLRTTIPVLAPLLLARFPATDEGARRRLEELPAHLDRVDAAIAEGVIGGAEPNAADFQVATSVRLLTLLEQVRPFVESRPAGKLALRLAPEYPGRFGPVFPDDWLATLKG
jgi:glutathione S-transferase